MADGQLLGSGSLQLSREISPSLPVKILVNMSVAIARLQNLRLQVQDVVRLVCDTDVFKIFHFNFALLIKPLLPRQLGLLHLINKTSLYTLLLLNSLLFVDSVLRLAELDTVRHIQVRNHIILHLGDVGAARLQLQLLLLSPLYFRFGLSLGKHATIQLHMRILDRMIQVGNEATLLRQLQLLRAILVVHLLVELLLRIILVEAFDEHGVLAAAVVSEAGHV